MLNKILQALCFVLLTSCTLSFQNVSTHGTATDVVDSDPSNDVKPTTTVSVPNPLIP